MINGWGHYEDECVEVAGKWKKISIKETRLCEEQTQTKRKIAGNTEIL